MTAPLDKRSVLLSQLSWQHAMGVDEVLFEAPASAGDITMRRLEGVGGKAPPHRPAGATPGAAPNAAPASSASAAAQPGAGRSERAPAAQRQSGGPAHDTAANPGAPHVARGAAKAAEGAKKGVSARDVDMAGHDRPEIEARLAKIAGIDKLREALEKEMPGSLCRTAGKTVFADGDPKAKIMVIDEVPDDEEDMKGLPLAGASGLLFERMLATLGLARGDVYIASLLPWRTPGRREPTVEELAFILPWIRRHIQLAGPQIVIVLGGRPSRHLLAGDNSLQNNRDKWHDVDFGDGRVRSVRATYHPRQLLRTPQLKGLAFADLLAICEKIG